MMQMETLHNLFRDMSTLSGDGLRKLADYAKQLSEDAEIKELEATYGTTPNAETIAAMKELESGTVEAISFEEFKAQIDALD